PIRGDEKLVSLIFFVLVDSQTFRQFEISKRLLQISWDRLPRFFASINAEFLERSEVGIPQDSFFFDVDVEWRFVLLRQCDVDSDFPFQAYISHQAATGLGVNARQIASVRVAVRVAVS